MSNIPAMRQKLVVCLAILLLITTSLNESHCYPLSFRDSSGRDISINEEPLSVVSLVPFVTEIICRIGAGERLKAITYHSTYPPETANKKIIGGFLAPDLDLVEELKPDIIFYNGIQKGVVERFGNSDVILIDLETTSIAESFRHSEVIGKIFDREKEAGNIIRENIEYIDLIKKKTALIPFEKRKRVMRLMGRETIMTPGDDSFQREFITLAGGIPPITGKKGGVVEFSKEDLIKFDPQVIYGCGNDNKVAERFFAMPGYKDLEAVRNNQVFYFPCDLTCRASTNTGYFIFWLSARVYREEFAKEENLILPEKVVDTKEINIDLDYVKGSRIDYSNIYDFLNKSLIIEFSGPINVLSTLEGSRKGIKTIGNHYSPLACWAIGHETGPEGLKKRVYDILDRSQKDTSFLFTGADVENVSIIKEEYRELSVYALVTAGVKSNAMRMSMDDGGYYEPGTINILILPNMKLSDRAMTRAVITATEAKSAALQDLDIRSGYNPEYQATGTGTDNIIIAGGMDKILDNSGGHTRFGELIAKAVYRGVKSAIHKQNGITTNRNVFQRLKERKINIADISLDDRERRITKGRMMNKLEGLLLEPEYASFISSSLSISDDYERGLITDLSGFKRWCKIIAQDISGTEITEMDEFIVDDNTPMVIRMALNALLNGISRRGLKYQ